MRKKIWLVAILVAVVLVGVIGANSAFAQETPTPPDGRAWNTGGYCGGGGGMMGSDPVTMKRVAGVLGLTYEQLSARLTKGETIAQVAQAQGVASSLVVNTILAPQSEMLQVRVKNGYLTEAQAQAIQEQARLRIEQAITVPLNGSATSPGGYAPGCGGGTWGGLGGGMMGGGRGRMMGNW